MIGICCVGSGVKYHLLSYWSIVMTSSVEFSTVNFALNRFIVYCFVCHKLYKAKEI